MYVKENKVLTHYFSGCRSLSLMGLRYDYREFLLCLVLLSPGMSILLL